jgi:phosphoglycolate phosphatase
MNSNFTAPIPFDLIGFDLDGTMVDSSADITAALNNTLASIGRGPLTLAEVHAMVGGGSRNLVEQALRATGGDEGLDVDALLALQLETYEAHIADHTRPFEGLVEALDALEAQGIRSAVVTNKVEKLARLLLEKLGLLHRFAFVIGGDTLGAGRAKPHPDMLIETIRATGAQNMAFVGDTIYDVSAAKAAGCPCIVLDIEGSGGSLGADHVIHHYADLMPLLHKIGASA